jgi:hypothetical protein
VIFCTAARLLLCWMPQPHSPSVNASHLSSALPPFPPPSPPHTLTPARDGAPSVLSAQGAGLLWVINHISSSWLLFASASAPPSAAAAAGVAAAGNKITRPSTASSRARCRSGGFCYVFLLRVFGCRQGSVGLISTARSPVFCCCVVVFDVRVFSATDKRRPVTFAAK